LKKGTKTGILRFKHRTYTGKKEKKKKRRLTIASICFDDREKKGKRIEGKKRGRDGSLFHPCLGKRGGKERGVTMLSTRKNEGGPEGGWYNLTRTHLSSSLRGEEKGEKRKGTGCF